MENSKFKQVFAVGADIGSVKLGTKDVFFYFSNGYGDGSHMCIVYEKGHDVDVLRDSGHFEGSFIVRKDKSVHLYNYDCGNTTMYCFQPGRYFVYSDENGDGTVTIYYLDDEIES